MSCKRPTQRVRFQKGINPYTGCNERDFPAGNYIHDVVQGKVRALLERYLVPNGYVLDSMEFHTAPPDPSDAVVRLEITPPVGDQETHDVRVTDEGVRPWAGRVGPILVAWVREHYSL